MVGTFMPLPPAVAAPAVSSAAVAAIPVQPTPFLPVHVRTTIEPDDDLSVFTPPATFEENARRVIQGLKRVSYTMDDGASLTSASAVEAGLVPDALRRSVARFRDFPGILRLAVESACRRAASLVERGDAVKDEAVRYVIAHFNAMHYLFDVVRCRQLDADAANDWMTWYSLEKYLSAKICEAGQLIVRLG